MNNTLWLYDLIVAGFGLIIIIVFLIYTFSTALLGRWVAKKKGYSTIAWFWICFLFGVFGLIAICGVPSNTKSDYENSQININHEKKNSNNIWA
jgi:hypothetical protein